MSNTNENAEVGNRISESEYREREIASRERLAFEAMVANKFRLLEVSNTRGFPQNVQLRETIAADILRATGYGRFLK